MKVSSIVFSLAALTATVTAIATPQSEECECGKSSIVAAAKEFGCHNGDVQCACSHFWEIKPGADKKIAAKCPNEFDCSLKWAKAMCRMN